MINQHIDVPHRIEAIAHDTMAAERLRTWDGNPSGEPSGALVPLTLHGPGSRIVCDRKGRAIRLYVVMEDKSKLVTVS